ncbi:MAG: hypothetical protein WA962_11330 [Ornithinimicrobium sp.]
MGLFSRKTDAEPTPQSESPPPEVELDENGLPTTPTQRLRDVDRDQITADVHALQADGVDIDDLSSLARGFDSAYAQWSQDKSQDHRAVVRRYASGIGEHLDRHTDLDWCLVTDVFGTDVGLADGPRGDFMIVPGNLVAARWMRGETGWIPNVVGHIVRRRER